MIKVNCLAAGRPVQRVPAPQAGRKHRRDLFMHGAPGGFTDDPSQEDLRERALYLGNSGKECIATAITSMEYSDSVSTLFETANLLANESFHSPKSLRWFCGQNKNFCLQLLPSTSFE